VAVDAGMSRAQDMRVGGVRRYQDLFAWQLADKFKAEIYRLVMNNYQALHAWKYRDQILESASAVPKDILEGFIRYSPAQFAQFLTCALASLAEAEEWLKDGVGRGYFKPKDAESGLLLAKRAWMATLGLKRSQDREAKRRSDQRRQTRKRRTPRQPPNNIEDD
jgi:four helix bundle protein